MELFTSVRQKSKTQSDNKINLDKACVHDNYLGNLIVFFFDCQRESVYCFAFVKNYLHGPAVPEWFGAIQYIFPMMIIFDKSKTIN